MSHSKHMDEHRHDDAELRLVDLLYGELHSEHEVHALEREHEAELGELRSLRTLLRSMPDEEPPAALTAKLMHAATVHAPKRAASSERTGVLGWLASLFRPIAMYPGLAAAASLVLVVGVAGTLYLSGHSQMAEPRTAAPAPAATATATPAADVARAENAALAEPAERAREEEAAKDGYAPAQEEAGAASGQAMPLEGAVAVTRDDERRAKRAASSVSPEKKSVGSRKKDTAELEPELARTGRYYEGDELAAAGAGMSKGEAAKPAAAKPASPAPVQQQAPAPPPPPVASAPASAEPADDAEADKSQTSQQTRIHSLHDEARAAAGMSDCATVREIADRIRAIDKSYYSRQFLADKRLAACLAAK